MLLKVFCLGLLSFVLCGPSSSEGGERMVLQSPDFVHKGRIPARFTCQGEDVSPNLVISGVPAGAKSLALIVDDPDAPGGNWDHWIVFNIPAQSMRIAAGSVPGTLGANDFDRLDWGGPCPPRGEHRYFFKLYALNKELSVKPGVRKEELLMAMEGAVLEKAELVGVYQKH